MSKTAAKARLSLPAKTERVEVAGMPFDLLDAHDVEFAIRNRSSSELFEYVVTPNVDHVVRSHRLGLRHLYDDAWISVCDSRVLAKLAPLLAIRFPAVVTGSDLTRQILDSFLRQGDHITVIGCTDEQVAKLRAIKANIEVHHFNPPMGFINQTHEVQRAVDFVLSHPSRFTFLAVGSPQQEKLAIKIKEAGGTGLGLCIGASILFVVGAESRAPNWIQSINLEWLYRLVQNPKRLWRRYLIDNPKIFLLILQERLASKYPQK